MEFKAIQAKKMDVSKKPQINTNFHEIKLLTMTDHAFDDGINSWVFVSIRG